MDKPLVSIIIPVYNAEKYLAECIESAINQTWVNKEIILVDNGSTDNSLQVALKYESAAVKVFKQPNKGASAARNKGLKEAKGAFIQFLDADDLLSENKIESQLKELIDNDGFICLCATADFFDGDNYRDACVTAEWFSNGSNNPVDFLIKLYAPNAVISGYGGMIQTNAWLCPAEIIRRAGNWNENLTVDDDGEFFCRVVLAAKGIKYSSDGVNYYRKFKTHSSLSATRTWQSYNSIMLAVDLKMMHLKKHTEDQIIEKIFASHYWWPGVYSYPQFKDLSRKFITKAKRLHYTGKKYKAGSISNFFAPLIGWRLLRLISFYKHGF